MISSLSVLPADGIARFLNCRATRTLSGFALIFVAAAAIQSASASEVFYTDQTAFNTAVAAEGLTASSFDFNSTPSGDYDTAAGLTIDGVNFVGPTGSGSYWLNLTPAYYCCDDYNNPNVSLQGPALTSVIYGITNGATDITLPSGTTAFSLTAYTVEAGDYSDSGYDTLNLAVDGSTGQTTTSAGSGTGFIGVISTDPITSAVLTGSTNEDFVDFIGGSVAIGTPAISATTPEPSTWGLLFVVGGILSALGWRRSRRSATA